MNAAEHFGSAPSSPAGLMLMDDSRNRFVIQIGSWNSLTRTVATTFLRPLRGAVAHHGFPGVCTPG